MASRNLPHHLYVHVDSEFIRKDRTGFEPAVWFAIRSTPNRAWGCHVMLECGAVYRNVPPHAIAFSAWPELMWSLQDAQVWDCYGTEFDVIKYDYLADLEARYDSTDDRATCLFTACPHGDGFSAAPEQSKEFMFMRTEGDRLLIRPTNMLLFTERSFTEDTGWPTDIMTSTQVWNCE
jgi:hypothetical protein